MDRRAIIASMTGVSDWFILVSGLDSFWQQEEVMNIRAAAAERMADFRFMGFVI